MCGRYKLSTPGDELWEAFDLHGFPIELPPHFNIAPTQQIAIIRTPHQLEFVRWGLAQPSARSGGFNVRVESLAAPTYREAIRQRRCLVLADGFYEWRADGSKKQPFLVVRNDRRPFAFAGIWQDVMSPKGDVVPAAAILTTKPRGALVEVHDRMPLILPTHARDAWLDSSSRYRDLLEPDVETLQLVPVSTLVNSSKNDDARLIEPQGG